MDIPHLRENLTLEEKAALLAGADFWSTVAIERLGIPSIKVTDGPNGARGGGTLVNGVSAACLPCGVAMGATWDTEAAEAFGAALAQESKSKGAQVLLGPTVNLHRSGLSGRNFECMSEDPHLTAELAIKVIEGLQDNGVAATIKHFVANDSEFERTTISSEVDERTLRELYMVPFEAAVKRAGVAAVMTGYNKLNGTYCGDDAWLLQDVLRDDWGFDGLIMSDWFGLHSTDDSVTAGVELEMPGPTRHRGAALVRAVHDGRVAEADVDARVDCLLRFIDRLGAFEEAPSHAETAENRPEHRALIRKMGASAAVLLKNEGLLPLDGDTLNRVAVIGPNGDQARIMGGGSAQINAHHRISPLDGLRAALPGVPVDFARGVSSFRYIPAVEGQIKVAFYPNQSCAGDPVFTETSAVSDWFWFDLPHPELEEYNFSVRTEVDFTPTASGSHAIGLISAGFSKLYIDDHLAVDADTNWRKGTPIYGHGNDEIVEMLELEAGRTYQIRVDYRNPEPKSDGIEGRALRFGITRRLGDADILEAETLARAADVVVLCVGRNEEWDTEGSDLPDMRLPGRQDELIDRILAANSRTVIALQTGGPVEMPWLDQARGVLQFWYPGQEAGHAIADVVLGKAAPGGRLPQTFPRRVGHMPAMSDAPRSYPGVAGKVRYDERTGLGYRHFDTAEEAPLFPFGFGLSYTRFDWAEPGLVASAPPGTFTVSLDIHNTGALSGTEIVQLYVAARDGNVTRPLKELRAFARLELAAGETGRATLAIGPRELAYYDVAAATFVAPAGRYDLILARNAGDTVFTLPVTLSETWYERAPAHVTA